MKTNKTIIAVALIFTVILTAKHANSVFANTVVNAKYNSKATSQKFPIYFSENNSLLIYYKDDMFKNKTVKRDFFYSKYNTITNSMEKSVNISEEYSRFIEENKEMKLKEIFVCIDNDIYSVNFNNKEFTTIKLNINTKNIESSPCLSPDGNTLYFTSNRKGSFGGTDIFASERLSNGKWSTPFFSSKGHNSMGGYDVYTSTLNYDGIWSSSINLGASVNSTSDDLNYITDSQGANIYYSTDKFEKGCYSIIDLNDNSVLFCPESSIFTNNNIKNENTAAIYLSIF